MSLEKNGRGIHPQEIRNMRRYFETQIAPNGIDWRQFMRETVPNMPPEVECEPCGAPYVRGAGLCHNPDEFEAPTGGHITIQRPRRPWNRES